MHASATAVEEFATWHESLPEPSQSRYYKKLIPISKPGKGEQYAFEVNLDQCTGCKSCVVACHSLNGLDDDESWRDVGMLLGRHEDPYLQTITSACHHCADPACANGCPVLKMALCSTALPPPLRATSRSGLRSSPPTAW